MRKTDAGPETALPRVSLPCCNAAMVRLLLGGVVPFLLCMAPIVGQAGTNGLEVRPDPQNVVASALLGEWRLDEALTKRLGRQQNIDRLEFRDDAKVLVGVPGPIAKKLAERRIYLAGVMVLRGKEQPFLLTEVAGNPTVVWFRERDGDPTGDAESFTVMLVRAEAKAADVLFVGGDANNQSFSAYARGGKPVGKLEPAAAITEMIGLLQAGKAREFVETYCSPEDLGQMVKEGRTMEKLVAQFEGERVLELIDILTAASKRPPTMSASGDEATWQLDKGQSTPGTLRLQRIDGRWYVRNR